MNELRKLLVSVFGIVISIVVTIAVMIKGWGLEPKSWWWIIGVYFIGHTIAALLIWISSDHGEKKGTTFQDYTKDH